MKQKIHKNTTEFVLCWLAVPGHRACSGMWFIFINTQWESIGEDWFCFSSNISCTLLRCRTLPLSAGPSQTWICTGLMCAGTVSLSSSVYCPVVSWRHCFYGVICHLWLSQSFCLFFCIGSWAGRALVKTSYLGVRGLKSLFSHCPVVSLLIFVYAKQSCSVEG